MQVVESLIAAIVGADGDGLVMTSTGLAAGALVLCAATAFAQSNPPPAPPAPQPMIVSSGDATVRVTPDRAFVTLATEVLAPTPSDAQQKNAAAATAVRGRLKALRLPDDAVKTVSYSLSEEYEFTNNKRISRGFRAVNQIEIRVDEIARIGEVVDASVQAGAATVSNIRFDVKERAAAERQALKDAVADARARAEAMVNGRLYDAATMNEVGNHPRQRLPFWWEQQP